MTPKDDLERYETTEAKNVIQLLGRLKLPRAEQAPPSFRAKVLAKVEQRRARPWWLAWTQAGMQPAWATALVIGLVCSVSLNFWWGYRSGGPSEPMLERALPLSDAFTAPGSDAPSEGEPQGMLERRMARRIALVIGNGAYVPGPLRNPVNDATDVAATLRQLGFHVTLLTDATERDMREALGQFGKALRSGDVGVFYFAGHGVQIEGQNYLIPARADIATEHDVEYEAVAAGQVLDTMEEAGNKLNIVILDACRNNPYGRRWRSMQGGLAPMQEGQGMLIAYAAASGQVALDGKERNSLYTKYLMKFLQEPGLSVEQVFKRVRVAVAAETRGLQIPWEATSLREDFYFVAPSPHSDRRLGLKTRPEAKHSVSHKQGKTLATIPPVPQPPETLLEGPLGTSSVNTEPAGEQEFRTGQHHFGQQEYAQAESWYRQAAEQGHAAAQFGLASLYDTGQAVSKDPTEAIKWYHQAAEQGHARAQYALGSAYLTGEKVAKDVDEAQRWYRKAADSYRKAAESGDPSAQLMLAHLYESGNGVPQDKGEAEKWLRRAAAQGITIKTRLK